MNIEELISQYIDGTLSTEAESELHHRLAVSPEARKLFRAHIMLRGVARDQRVLHAPTQGMRSRLFERLQREEGMTALADPLVVVAPPPGGSDGPAAPMSAGSGNVPHSIPSANLAAPHRRRRRAAPWLITLVIAGAMFVMFWSNTTHDGASPDGTKVALGDDPHKTAPGVGGESIAKNSGGEATPGRPAPQGTAFKSETPDASGHGLSAGSRPRADSARTALVAAADAPIASTDRIGSPARPARTLYRYSSRPSRLSRAEEPSRREARDSHGLLASGYSETHVLDADGSTSTFHTAEAEAPARAVMSEPNRSDGSDELRVPEFKTSTAVDDKSGHDGDRPAQDMHSNTSSRLGEGGGIRNPIMAANAAPPKVASVEPEKLKLDSDMEEKDIAAASRVSNERFGAAMPKKLEASKTDGAAPPPPPATLGRIERERPLPRNEQPSGAAAKSMNIPSAPEPAASQSEIEDGPALVSSNGVEAKSRDSLSNQHLASVEAFTESAPTDSAARRKSGTIVAQDRRPMSPPPALRIERDSAAAAASITMAESTTLRSDARLRDGAHEDLASPTSLSSSPRFVAGLEQHSLASITALADNATFELVAQTVVRAGLEFADGTSQVVLLVGIAGYRQTETSSLFAVRSGGVTTVLPTPVVSNSTTSRFDELWGGVGYRYRLQEGSNWGVGIGSWLGAGKRYVRIGLELPVWYRVSGTVRLQVIPIAAYVRRLNVAPTTDRTTIDPAQQDGEQRDRVSEPRAGGEILTGFGVGATVNF